MTALTAKSAPAQKQMREMDERLGRPALYARSEMFTGATPPPSDFELSAKCKFGGRQKGESALLVAPLRGAMRGPTGKAMLGQLMLQIAPRKLRTAER